jgi:hypothetical protein
VRGRGEPGESFVFLNAGEIWVMEASISNSFDGLDWQPTSNKRYGDEKHRRIFAKYKDQKGQKSQVYELRYEEDQSVSSEHGTTQDGSAPTSRFNTANTA